MIVTPFYFRFYMCVQIIITIERIIKIFFGRTVSLSNLLLRSTDVGCHIAIKAVNTFSYADNMTMVASVAYQIKDLLTICGKFAVYLTVMSYSPRSPIRPSICLAWSINAHLWGKLQISGPLYNRRLY